MKSISLPDDPIQKELEEYISSYFQADGYYIERNIIERDVEEILELDVIATDYTYEIPKLSLIEIKSGKWGFPEIFKVKGWLSYLQIKNSIFITNTSKGEPTDKFYKEKSKKLGIDLIIIQDLNKSNHHLREYMKGYNVESLDIVNWRYSYWIERILIRDLTRKKNSIKNVQRYYKLSDYYNKINNSIFFTENFLDRLHQLYKTFQENPKLSSKCGNEIIYGKFEGDSLPNSIYSKIYYDCESSEINISTYIEHRARLSILKNIVDYIIYKNKDIDHDKVFETKEILGHEISRFDLLPQDLREKIEILSEHKYVQLYPIFWQWFLWFFGGFILDDYKDREYSLLSSKTGIPIKEIDNAFLAYDLIFPQEDGWFLKIRDLNISLLKMFPVPFMGNGADYRKKKYTKNFSFEELKLSGKYTRNDLIKWNNHTVDLLFNK